MRCKSLRNYRRYRRRDFGVCPRYPGIPLYCYNDSIGQKTRVVFSRKTLTE